MKTFYKHILHSGLQNPECEISSGLGKLHQKHKENPSTQDSLEKLRHWSCSKQQDSSHRHSPNPCTVHTSIQLTGLFRLIRWVTANRDIKSSFLQKNPPYFCQCFFRQSASLKWHTAVLFAEWLREGQWGGPMGAISNGKQDHALFLMITSIC